MVLKFLKNSSGSCEVEKIEITLSYPPDHNNLLGLRNYPLALLTCPKDSSFLMILIRNKIHFPIRFFGKERLI